MRGIYQEASSLCPVCAADTPAHYSLKDGGVYFHGECPEHGPYETMVEKDEESFRWGYEQDYDKPFKHLSLPVTYRCNLRCTYCYSCSNSDIPLPADRSLSRLQELFGSYEGNLTFIGGEPTLREDLFDLIKAARSLPNIGRVSIATNGQKLRDMEFVTRLKDAGTDFVFLSFNDVEYDRSSDVHGNKLQALKNLYEARIPVWLQGTINSLDQVESFLHTLKQYRKVIFSVTLRAVKPLGIVRPDQNIFVSDILEYIGAADKAGKGTSPFNRFVPLFGAKVKVCSWVFDMKRIDPLDSDYVISDDTVTKFHRGTRKDEVLLKKGLLAGTAHGGLLVRN